MYSAALVAVLAGTNLIFGRKRTSWLFTPLLWTCASVLRFQFRNRSDAIIFDREEEPVMKRLR